MRAIKFKITDLNNRFMERTILRKLESLDAYFDVTLNRDTKEVSLSSRTFQRIAAKHIDNQRDWAIDHNLICPNA